MSLPKLPSLEQYARMLTAQGFTNRSRHDDAESYTDLGDAKVVSRVNTVSATKPMRIPIPKHLMYVSRGRSTNPVGKLKPTRRKNAAGGWRGVTAGDVANYGLKAWQLAKHLATLINVEEKCHDVDGSSGTALTTTPVVVNLSNIAQGNDYFNRSGDSILGQEIEFRCDAVSSAVYPSARCRVIIVRDKLQRGADPVLGDVLQGGSSPLVQPYLEPQDGRFDILYDHRFVVSSIGAALATSGTSTTYALGCETLPTLKRKFNNHIKYQNTTAADASNWVGGLFLLAVGDTASNGPSIYYSFRLRFTDN